MQLCSILGAWPVQLGMWYVPESLSTTSTLSRSCSTGKCTHPHEMSASCSRRRAGPPKPRRDTTWTCARVRRSSASAFASVASPRAAPRAALLIVGNACGAAAALTAPPRATWRPRWRGSSSTLSCARCCSGARSPPSLQISQANALLPFKYHKRMPSFPSCTTSECPPSLHIPQANALLPFLPPQTAGLGNTELASRGWLLSRVLSTPLRLPRSGGQGAVLIPTARHAWRRSKLQDKLDALARISALRDLSLASRRPTPFALGPRVLVSSCRPVPLALGPASLLR